MLIFSREGGGGSSCVASKTTRLHAKYLLLHHSAHNSSANQCAHSHLKTLNTTLRQTLRTSAAAISWRGLGEVSPLCPLCAAAGPLR